jgi:hypothetical protein
MYNSVSSDEEQTEARNYGSFDNNKNSPGFSFVQFYILMLSDGSFRRIMATVSYTQ